MKEALDVNKYYFSDDITQKEHKIVAYKVQGDSQKKSGFVVWKR